MIDNSSYEHIEEVISAALNSDDVSTQIHGAIALFLRDISFTLIDTSYQFEDEEDDDGPTFS